MTHNAHNFVMPMVADDYDLPTVLCELSHLIMYLLHQGAGGINNFHPLTESILPHLGLSDMSTEKDRFIIGYLV